MRVKTFFNEIRSDIDKLLNDKCSSKEEKENRKVSVVFRGMGVVVLTNSALSLLGTTLTPQITVAVLAYKLFMAAVGYDLIVTGNNIRTITVDKSVKATIKTFSNILTSSYNEEEPFFKGTYIFQNIYRFTQDFK